MKKASFKLLATMLVTACMSVTPLLAKDATTITLIHTNDTHGNVKDDGKSIIGFAKLATYAKEVKANENAIIVDAGDMFQGMPFANLENGHSVIKIANAVGYDAMTVGNHEFDFGAKNFFEIVKVLNFPVLASNLVTDDGKAVLESYIVKEVDDVKVGIFGMATEETAFKTHPDNIKGYKFTDMIAAAQKNVKILREKKGVDVVIMVGHLGLDEGDYTSDLVAKAVEGIDVIVDGHSHSKLEEGRLVNNTLIVSTGDKLNNVGRVEITVEDGKVENKTAKLIGYNDFAEVTPNVEVAAEIEKVETSQNTLLDRVVGQTKVKLVGERSIVRTCETNLGQLTTDAILDLTGADVAFTNGGGIRASIEAGDITHKDMITVFPFGNTIMVKEIKGNDLKAALEHGVSEYPHEKGAFPHTAGMTFTLNAYKEAGNRISDLKVNGVAVDPNKMYTFATNDFIAAGGDGYIMLAQYPIKAEYNTLMDTLLDYVEKSGVVEGKFEPRMTVVTEAPVSEAVEKVETGKMVALRSYLQEQKFEVKYANKQIIATKENITITFTIGQAGFTVKDANSSLNGKLSTGLKLKNNTTYVNTADVAKILADLVA
ncbi:bifunctional metallophosphatase/5'-nucleotidase [Cellulosilyticum ruminicola]|uniref:bifunctional metallophosphatase/5'-nucleotidase n=1 Tax=Cellulosilyticum ruminicola TaxID=425254 RepID=UPI000B0B2740|nr:5'-nucleotidase C-terminal domain-containing protein [Cellulosilyticum ruminicola]